jgi:hypothetical protein
MSTKTDSVFAPGQDPAAIEANRAYQDALAKLTQSLDQRKNRFFDPTYLAAAQGFLEPGSPDFFESLGRVAGNIGKAQEAGIKEDQTIAQQRLELAGRGVELQRQKGRDAMFRSAFGEQPAPVGGLSAAAQPAAAQSPSAASGALPSGGQGATGALAQAAPIAGPRGTQIAPAIPGVNKQQYLASAQADGKSLTEALEKWDAIEKGRIQVREGSVFNTGTGMAYQFPTGKTEDVQIFKKDGTTGTYKVPANIAVELYEYARKGEADNYYALAERITQGPQSKKPDAQGASSATPGGGLPSKEESEVRQEEAKTRAGVLAKSAGEKEASIEDTYASAQRLYESTTRVADYLKQSPNFFGIFARPGVIPAIGKLIKEGIQTPGGTLNLAGFEDSMRAAMPGVTQRDLDNISKAAAELAEMELTYTRLYLAKQGAVTEGERKIVRAIPGTTSSSTEVLRTRMELLKSRAQFDLDVVDAFRQWQDDNPGRSYLEFERKSNLYKEIKKNFAEETEKIFGGIKAVPTRQRVAEAAAKPPPGKAKDLASARAQVEAILKD